MHTNTPINAFLNLKMDYWFGKFILIKTAFWKDDQDFKIFSLKKIANFDKNHWNIWNFLQITGMFVTDKTRHPEDLSPNKAAKVG